MVSGTHLSFVFCVGECANSENVCPVCMPLVWMLGDSVWCHRVHSNLKHFLFLCCINSRV
jgi:hypothetical protein